MKKTIEIFLFLALLFLAGACQQTREIKINEEHRFEFNACDMTYNGMNFQIGDSIQKMVNLFGPYDRKIRLAHDTYVWDSLGTSIYVPFDKSNVVEFIIVFDFQRTASTYPDGKENDFARKVQADIQASVPKPFFEGGIMIGGVPFDGKSSIKEFNSRGGTIQMSQSFLPSAYEAAFGDCDPPVSYYMNKNRVGDGTLERFGVTEGVGF